MNHMLIIKKDLMKKQSIYKKKNDDNTHLISQFLIRITQYA